MATKKEQRIPKEPREPRGDASGVFVPAGLLIGMGLGFVYSNLPAGLFIGLGVGLLVMALIKLFRRR